MCFWFNSSSVKIPCLKFFLILFSLCLFTYSQSNNLRGRILDSKNFPLPGAIVKIESEDLFATSDFDGYFLIQNLKEGSFTINISYVGYEDLTDEISIPLSNNNDQPIYILETKVTCKQTVSVSQTMKNTSHYNCATIQGLCILDHFCEKRMGWPCHISTIEWVPPQNSAALVADIWVRNGAAPSRYDRMP